ncbi:MAG: hypothetical protein Q9180_007700, partial [Flavoplaca navasiana]
PSSNPNDIAAPMLGRHEVQHAPNPFKGLKRPGSDGGPFQDDGNDQQPIELNDIVTQKRTRSQSTPIVTRGNNKPTGNEENSGSELSPTADDLPVFLYIVLEAESEADATAPKNFASDYDRLLDWNSDHRLKFLKETKPSKRRLENLDRQAEEEFQRIQSRISAYRLVFSRNMARDDFKQHIDDTTDLPPIEESKKATANMHVS